MDRRFGRTLRKHEQNCWLIGKFTCDYGGFKTYAPAVFLGGPRYLDEFRRKVSSSAYAFDSYGPRGASWSFSFVSRIMSDAVWGGCKPPPECEKPPQRLTSWCR